MNQIRAALRWAALSHSVSRNGREGGVQKGPCSKPCAVTLSMSLPAYPTPIGSQQRYPGTDYWTDQPPSEATTVPLMFTPSSESRKVMEAASYSAVASDGIVV